MDILSTCHKTISLSFSLFKIDFNIYLCVCMCASLSICLSECVCVCVTDACRGAHGGHKRASDVVKQELQALVRYWGTGNGIWVLCKKSNSSTGEPYIQPPFFSFKERNIQKSYETLQILTHSSQLILFLPLLQNDKRHSLVSLWHCQWSQPCLKRSRQKKKKRTLTTLDSIVTFMN